MIREIIDYKLLMSGSIIDLTMQVKQAIKEGWQPYGSLSGNKAQVIQPMVVYRLL